MTTAKPEVSPLGHTWKNLFTRLASTKLLAAVGGFVTLLSQKRYAEAAGVLGAYVVAQAGLDIVTVNKVVDSAQAEASTVTVRPDSSLLPRA